MSRRVGEVDVGETDLHAHDAEVGDTFVGIVVDAHTGDGVGRQIVVELSRRGLDVAVCQHTASPRQFDDGIQQGYRGFADFSYTLGVGDWGKNHDRIGIMTSHGYQIAPQFFAGVGVGFNYYFNGHDELSSLPVFAHIRSDILADEITPFIDLRVGYSLIDVEGVYINPSVGCRFELTDDIGEPLILDMALSRFF